MLPAAPKANMVLSSVIDTKQYNRPEDLIRLYFVFFCYTYDVMFHMSLLGCRVIVDDVRDNAMPEHSVL